MRIIEGTMEELIDPTGIIQGQRFEFRLQVMMDEEDELYDENGTGLRLLYAVQDGEQKMLSYQFYEPATDRIYDMEWDEDEEKAAEQFCLTLLDEGGSEQPLS